MSADGSLPAVDEAQKISVALNALLDLVVAEWLKPKPSVTRSGPTMFTLQSIEQMLSSTEAEEQARAICGDPIGQAARLAIRALGKRLYELGGLDLMLTVAEDTAELGPYSGYRISVIDHRWDGIGRTGGSAGWCA